MAKTTERQRRKWLEQHRPEWIQLRSAMALLPKFGDDGDHSFNGWLKYMTQTAERLDNPDFKVPQEAALLAMLTEHNLIVVEASQLLQFQVDHPEYFYAPSDDARLKSGGELDSTAYFMWQCYIAAHPENRFDAGCWPEDLCVVTTRR